MQNGEKSLYSRDNQSNFVKNTLNFYTFKLNSFVNFYLDGILEISNDRACLVMAQWKINYIFPRTTSCNILVCYEVWYCVVSTDYLFYTHVLNMRNFCAYPLPYCTCVNMLRLFIPPFTCCHLSVIHNTWIHRDEPRNQWNNFISKLILYNKINSSQYYFPIL